MILIVSTSSCNLRRFLFYFIFIPPCLCQNSHAGLPIGEHESQTEIPHIRARTHLFWLLPAVKRNRGRIISPVIVQYTKSRTPNVLFPNHTSWCWPPGISFHGIHDELRDDDDIRLTRLSARPPSPVSRGDLGLIPPFIDDKILCIKYWIYTSCLIFYHTFLTHLRFYSSNIWPHRFFSLSPRFQCRCNA